MYSLTQPILAETSAMATAGTAAAETARTGMRLLIFMARFLLIARECFRTATPLHHPCHRRVAI
jgi:hypothetical protein